MSRTRIGAMLWIGAALMLQAGPFEVMWARLLLMLAPLVLVPMGLEIVCRSSPNQGWILRASDWLQLPAASLLGWSQLLPAGPTAGWLAIPWLLFTGLLAIAGGQNLRRHRSRPLSELCITAATLFIFVGGSWAVLDRFGLRPLGFEPVIVLLTAIHFHYAGFALPLAAGLALRASNTRLSRLAGIGVIAGVPLVAVGITATQLGADPWLETLAALTLASAGAFTAALHLRLARQAEWPRLVRWLWGLAATSLAFSMALAVLYGLRFYLPLAWLDIPWMRALHGSANALGFALPALAGWHIANNTSR